MTRNLKALGLALVAVFAMNAVAASAASAEAAHFTFGTGATTIKGEQVTINQFSTDTGVVKCTTATFESTVFNEAEATFTPTYTGCKFAGLASTIDVNECDYLITAGEKVGTEFIGSMRIKCPTGKVIEVTGPECTITIPEQTPTSGFITYTNAGGPGNEMDIAKDLSLSGIHYIEHGSGCTSQTTETTINGTLSGSITIRVFNNVPQQVSLTLA